MRQKTLAKSELKSLSLVVSKRLKRKIVLKDAKEIKSGFQSDAFRLTSETGESFFIKRIKPSNAGFETPERHLFSFITSHGMGQRSSPDKENICVIISENDRAVSLPEINLGTAIYHMQYFKSGLNKNYWELLQEKKAKQEINKEDKDEISQIISLLIKIHSGALPSADKKILKALYNDSLHSILAYQGFFFTFLADFKDNHPLLPPKRHGEYIGYMLAIIYEWLDRHERIRTLHGDFWGTNIFLGENKKAKAIDFSRLPYGDPGIDIGFFFVQFLWLYHETQNEYFKKLGELFITEYEKKTGDEKIRKALCVPIGLLAILYINPRFHPENNPNAEKKFFDAIIKSLRKKELVWE